MTTNHITTKLTNQNHDQRHKYHHLTTTLRLTLKMTTAHVVETFSLPPFLMSFAYLIKKIFLHFVFCTLPSQIGSRRCHDPQEEECVNSQLGSGPGTGNSGTGYYTVDQYKEILRYHFLSASVPSKSSLSLYCYY